MINDLTKVGIIGGSGFTGEELLRFLSNHPNTEVIAISSRTLLGQSTNQIVEGSDLIFIEPDNDIFYDCEVVFFATPHGVSMNLVNLFINKNIRVKFFSRQHRIRIFNRKTES